MAAKTPPTMKLDLDSRVLSRRSAGVQQQTGRAVIGGVRLRQPASLADALALVGGQVREMAR